MQHSITFVKNGVSVNTWDDWFLIPVSRPTISPPEIKTVTVDIPGSDGDLDLTEALNGDVNYKDREGELSFLVENGHGNWIERYSDIMNFIHGQKCKMILVDDPNYYYEGRFTVSSWDSLKDRSQIIFTYKVNPYKFSNNPFNQTFTLNGSEIEVNITTDRMPVSPKFTVTGSDVTVKYEGTTYQLVEGENKVANIRFTSGAHKLYLNGTGSVNVVVAGGRL